MYNSSYSAKNTFYFIPGKESSILAAPIGYNPEVVEAIKRHGFQLILRVPNMSLPEENEFIIDQLLAIIDENTDKILFQGNSVIGYP